MSVYNKIINSFILWTVLLTFGIICTLVIESHAQETIVYKTKAKRDPFTPLVKYVRVRLTSFSGLIGVESIDDIIIEGLVYDPAQGSMAIVNDEVLSKGDSEGDVSVVDIREDGVMFRIKGKNQFKSYSPEL